MSAHVAIQGQGPDLVLVHGWGLHGGVWTEVAAALATRHRVHCVDLPGFGRSPLPEGPYTLEALARAVADVVPQGAPWVGWSLGGMVALAAALEGVPIPRLVLVGTSPRFVTAPDWPHAVDPAVLDAFATDLEGAFEATLLRFLALQTRGAEDGRETLRRLRAVLEDGGPPRPAALQGGLAILQGGLAILRRSDLRVRLDGVGQPTLLVQGERDTLVSAAAAEATARLLPDARVTAMPGAGHAPFLSHPDRFIKTVEGFVDGG